MLTTSDIVTLSFVTQVFGGEKGQLRVISVVASKGQ